MGLIGAETDQLVSLKQTFDREKTEVERLTSAISQQVQNAWWKGPAAERFKGQQWPGYEKMLRQLALDLDACSREVDTRREALVRAGS